MSQQKKFILALDQGTTSSRALLVDSATQVVGLAQKDFQQHYPQPSWVEHDPHEIWDTVESVIHDVLNKTGTSPADISGLGITNQRETTVLWDRTTGQAIAPAIVWQCRRTTSFCQTLARDSDCVAAVKRKTGLVLDPYFSATKIKWLLDNVAGARARANAGELCFGTMDTWILWHLTGGQVHATDITNASRTLLFDLQKRAWDPQLLDLFDIPASLLPEVQNSSSIFGQTTLGIDGIAPIPIAGIAGDQQAALFGQGCVTAGSTKNTYGTGCFLLMNTGETAVYSEHGLLTTLVLNAKGQAAFGLEGSVFSGGATIQWLRDELQMVKDVQETESLAQSVPDNQGVYLVPAFVGLGAPYWDPFARGTIVGLTRGSNRCHFIRAALESIVYQSCDVLRAMEQETGVPLTKLNVDGGACQNNFLMQFQADMLGAKVVRAANIESSVLGAAFLAGLATGFWRDMAHIQASKGTPTIYQPHLEADTRQDAYQNWQRAVEKAKGWAKKGAQ